MSEAELIDQYISALQRDVNSPPPPGLDGDMADFVRQMTIALDTDYSTPPGDQWSTLLNTVQASPNAYKVRRQTWFRQVTRLAAVLGAILIGAFLLFAVFRSGNKSASVELIRSPEQMNREAFLRYIDEAWNNGNLDVLGEVFAPDYVRHDPLLLEDTVGLEAERGLITNFRSALPDLQVRIRDVTADGNRVWAQLTITGTHTAPFEMADGRLAPPSGNSVTWTTTSLSRVEDGEIAEIWIGADTLDFMQQLGMYADLQITIPDGDVQGLIDAINAANDEVTNPGPDTITLAENGVYTLTEIFDPIVGGRTGLPGITSEITINGNGATIERSSVEGTPEFRILYVSPEGDLRLDNITIRNGEVSDGAGGGICNEGEMTVTNSTFSDNLADVGGGIVNLGIQSQLSISNTIFSGNSATDGGGIGNHGDLAVTNSTFSGNAASEGGGIWNRSGQITINNSTFVGNSVTAGGGGIRNYGDATVIDSTFSDNTSAGTGGGFDNRQTGQATIANSTFVGNSANCAGGVDNVGEMTIRNSTFSGNSTERCAGGVGNTGPLTISNSTITDNTAAVGLGTDGIGNNGGEITIKNSIIANDGDADDCEGRGSLTAIGNNLTIDGSCPGFTQITSDALNLGSLADNGGPTQTRALLPGSVAIDAAADCTDVDDNPMLHDQRGVERPQGAACDIGAFEVSDSDIER